MGDAEDEVTLVCEVDKTVAVASGAPKGAVDDSGESGTSEDKVLAFSSDLLWFTDALPRGRACVEVERVAGIRVV